MSFSAKKVAGPAIKVLEAGTYPTKLKWLVLLGTQPQRPFKNEPKPDQDELLLGYEFLDEFLDNEDGQPDETKPRFLSERFPFHNLSADRAKSTQRYMSLDPDLTFDGDWSRILGAPVNTTITARTSTGNGKTYNNVASVSRMRDRDAKRWEDEGILPAVLFDINDADMEAYKLLPDWVKTVLSEAVNYQQTDLYRKLNAGAKVVHKEEAPAKQVKAKEEEEESDDEAW